MSVYDEIDVEDMHFNCDDSTLYYPCPCGDLFRVSLEDLKEGEDVATCPSCSLIIRVVYELDRLDEVVKRLSQKEFAFNGKR